MVVLLCSLVALGGLWAHGKVRLDRERGRTQAALAKAESSQRRVSDSFHMSPSAMALANLTTGLIVEVNGAYTKLIGRERADLIGAPIADLGIASAMERARLIRRLRRSALVRDYATRFERRSGGARDVLLSLDLVDIDRQPHMLKTVTDQTEHLRAVAALRQTDERMRELARAIDEVFYISSPDRFTLHYISPAYEKVWGRSLASVYANPLTVIDAIVDEERDAIRASMAKASEDELSLYEFRIARPDGSVRWIRMKEFPVRGPDGNVQRLAGVAADVTEQRALEEQLRQAQKMESIGMLAGGIAHDFNNLLAVISSCSGLLAEAIPTTNPDHELVDEISSAVVRATGMTRQLLAFSRKHVAEAVVLDANTVVTDTRKHLRRVIGNQIELVTSLDPELRPVRIDRGQLVQVILNLALNARDAMGDTHGTLTVATRNVGNTVVVEIVDNGTGMPPEIAARAFEPFFTTKEQGKNAGTGMGLAVVHGIVDQAGGKVELDSKRGHGTAVRVFLPAYGGPAQAAKPRAAAEERGVESILIVDDDDYVRRATARALRNRGYTVTEAPDGRGALTALSAAKFDLMLSDIVMPGMNGRVLAEAARSRFPELRILFMTGYTDDEILKGAVSSGQVELIEKPFTIPALAAKVRAVLDAETPMRETGRIPLAIAR